MRPNLAFAVPLVCAAVTDGSRTSADAVVVTVPSGKIDGVRCESSGAGSFLGIPFAEPPVGQLRFMPPKLKTLANTTFNNGTLNAKAFGSTCIQWHKSFAWETPRPSEDCLYLNVYAPPAQGNGTSSLPVKVFAYGGGNNAGAADFPLYDACSLASDSVVVTFNYRLGPLGFLALERAGVGGNMAIQDYLAALQWVREEISHFGGDSRKVLLFGQSAGAADSFVVSTLDEAKDLVAAVALESGGGQDLTPNALAQDVGQSYAQTLGCSADDLKCLQGKSVKALLDARQHIPALQEQEKNGSSLSSEYGLNIPNRKNLNSAILDGKIVKEQPLRVGSKVPLLTGFNQDDSSLFVNPLFPDRQAVTEKNYTDFLSQWGNSASAIGKKYPLSKFKKDGKSTGDAVVDAITHITTAAGFKCQVYRNLRTTTAAGTPAFAYLFNHTPSCPWLWEDSKEAPAEKRLPLYGAAHTAELAFVFGGLTNQPWGNGSCNATGIEHGFSRSMMEAWTAIAANGNPSTKEISWPRFAANKTRGVTIGQDQTSDGRIDFTECDLWDEIWAGFGGFNVSAAENNTTASDETAASKNVSAGAVKVSAAVIFGLSSAVLVLAFMA